MGGGSERSKADIQSQQAAAQAAQLSATGQQLTGISLPAFKQAMDLLSGILSGDTSKIQAFVGPSAESANQQYATAEKNIQLSTPRGGEQERALNEAEISKAGAISGIVPNIMERALQALTGAGATGTSSGMSGIGGAGSIYQGNAQTYASEANAKANMMGQMVGGAAQAAGTAYAGRKTGP